MPATTQNRKLFVNLAVADLKRSVAFFTRLGFEFDPRFTDESATCMLVGEDAYFMLLAKERFAGFRPNAVVDSTDQTEALFAVTADSRQAVDDLEDTALASGGSPAANPQDHGFMYGRSFRDPDGHHFEDLLNGHAGGRAGRDHRRSSGELIEGLSRCKPAGRRGSQPGTVAVGSGGASAMTRASRPAIVSA